MCVDCWVSSNEYGFFFSRCFVPRSRCVWQHESAVEKYQQGTFCAFLPAARCESPNPPPPKHAFPRRRETLPVHDTFTRSRMTTSRAPDDLVVRRALCDALSGYKSPRDPFTTTSGFRGPWHTVSLPRALPRGRRPCSRHEMKKKTPGTS